MSRDLRVPPAVAAFIGPARAAEIEAGPYPAEYRCGVCRAGGMVADGEPLEACLDVHPGRQMRLWIRHRSCPGPRGVRHKPDPIVLPDDLRAVGVLAAVDCGPAGWWPLAVVEPLFTGATLAGPADTVDWVLSGYGRRGMALAADLRDPQPYLAGWSLALPGPAGGGGIFAPGSALLEPLPPPPPGWAELAAARGKARVYVASRIGIQEITGRGLGDGLVDAAAAGRMVGGTVPVR